MVFNKKMRSPLKSEKGQIAVFLVLVFQILFVFFAMSINVGLVVYDKINLQNSTDLAAYYAAQKQAEMLNQIAHINYQMRQAYKLLTFRLRVIGSASIGIGAFTSDIFNHSVRNHTDKLGAGRHAPGVCIEVPCGEYPRKRTRSLCQNLDRTAVPPAGVIPSFPGSKRVPRSRAREWEAQSGWCAQLADRRQLVSCLYPQCARAYDDRKNSPEMSKPGQEVSDHRSADLHHRTPENNLTQPQRDPRA